MTRELIRTTGYLLSLSLVTLACTPNTPSDPAGEPIPVVLPALLRAVALDNTGVLLTFSDEMEDAAVALGFYHVTGANPLPITAASFSADHLSVTLETGS
jgi:hypothetical protein